jgi:hypothetical protein
MNDEMGYMWKKVIFFHVVLQQNLQKEPQSSAEVKNGGGIPSLPHISSWHSALIN